MYPVETVHIDIEEILELTSSAKTVLDAVYEEAWDRVPDEFKDEYGNDFEESFSIDGQFVVVAFRAVR